jgi:hypothetical protein
VVVKPLELVCGRNLKVWRIELEKPRKLQEELNSNGSSDCQQEPHTVAHIYSPSYVGGSGARGIAV